MKLKNTEIHKLNPCLREQEQSFKCFSDNGSDKEACQMQIDNYNICKSFWVRQLLILLLLSIIAFVDYRVQLSQTGEEKVLDRTCRHPKREIR